MAIARLTMDSIRQPGPDNTLLGKVNELVDTLQGSSSQQLTLQAPVGTTLSGASANLFVRDTTAMAQGVGGALSFEANYLASGAYARIAVIKAMKTNGTDGNYSFDLVLGARGNGNPDVTEAIRIKDTGQVNLVEGAMIAGSGKTLGFYGTTPISKQTGVAVTIAAVHAALVNLGLIGA